MSVNIKFFIWIILIFLTSFIISIYQSIYKYDPFHWGLAQSSIDLLDGKLPYKDFFIHYGFLSITLKALFLDIFNKNILSTMYLSSLCFSLGNIFYFVFLINNFKFKNINIYLVPLVVFLLHPFANHPWHSYELYLFLVLTIYTYFSNHKLNKFFSGFFLGCACLINENFFYISLIIISYEFLLFKKKNITFSISFFFPLLIFYLYLVFFGLENYWLKTHTLNKAHLEIENTDLVTILTEFIFSFSIKSFYGLLKEPYYTIFFIIFISNIYFLINETYKILILKKTNTDTDSKIKPLLFLSLIALLSSATAIHNLDIFRLSTSLVVGIIIPIYYLNKINLKYKNSIIVLIIIILLLSNITPIKKSNNLNFPYLESVNNNDYSSEFLYFNSQKWSKSTWATLSNLNKVNISVSKNCPEISHFINFTEDAFIYMISHRLFNSDQYLYWLGNEKFFKILLSHFDKSLESIFKTTEFKKTIIISNIQKVSFLKSMIDYSEYEIIDLPYSYEIKKKIILIPKKCYEKINFK